MIELLLVLFLVSAIAAIAIRSVGDTIRRDRVQKVVAIMTTDIEAAFAISARQRTPVRLLFDSTRLTFAVASRADTSFKYKSRQFSTGDLTIDYISPSRTTLDVLPSGLASDTLSVRFGIYSRGVAYDRTLRMTRGGLMRVK